MNTIIEKIRALINMQIRREELNFASLGGGGQTMNIGALEWVLKQLDTLQDQPVKIDIRKELASIEFMGVNDARDTETIARHFYALGQQSKEQPVCEGEEEEYEQIKQKVCSDCPSHKDDYCGYVKRQLQRKCNYLSDVMYGYELGRQSKPTTAEGLEEEIQSFWNRASGFQPKFATLEVKENGFAVIARHFAKWGAEHLKK